MVKRKVRRGAKQLYISYRRHSTNVFHAAPVFLRQRFSYIIDARRIFRILPEALRLHFWIIILLQFLSALVITGTVYIMVMFIQSISSPDSLRAGYLFRTIVPMLPDYWIFRLKGDRTLITAMCLLVVLFIIMKNVIVFISNTYSTVFTERVGLHISREAYGRFLAKDYLWHVSDASRQMIARIDCRTQLTTMLINILSIFGNVLCTIILCVALFLYRPQITVLVFSTFVVVSVLVYFFLRRKIDAAGVKAGAVAAKQAWAIRMTTRGIREVVIYRKQRVFLDSISETMREGIPYRTFLTISRSIPAWFLEVTGFVIIFSVMVYLVDDGRPMPQTIGIISMLLVTAWRTLPLFNRSMGAAVHIRGIRSRALSCLELLESFTEPLDDENKRGIVDPHFHLERSIELKNVIFKYPQSKTTTLNSLSLTINRGESVALVGKSGAGKSTAGMLVAGLFQPMKGTMLVDGVDIKSGILDSYRQLVGYVPQNPLLLPGTLVENIALSRWGEEPDMDKIRTVCEMAAMDFVLDGKKNLKFRIGDGGEGLSGGEAQRLAIARALYTDPEILIFDEATSSLDRAAESVIERTVESLRGTVTSIVIAHRLTTVERCDRVIWLDNGKVREMGPPAEILPKYTEECAATP